MAAAYLKFLFTPEAQDIIARHHFRPRDQAALEKYKAQFPAITTFSVETLIGPWSKVLKDHFGNEGVYDQIAVGSK